MKIKNGGAAHKRLDILIKKRTDLKTQ